MNGNKKITPDMKMLLGRLLMERELITEEQLNEALAEQRRSGNLLGKVLVEKGYVSEENILSVLDLQMGMEEIDASKIEPSLELLDKLTAPVAKAYKIIPVKMEKNVLTVAMGDPLNIQILDDLRFMLDCHEVKGLRSNEADINEAIDKFYGGKIETINELLKQIETETAPLEEKEEEKITDLTALEEMAKQLPIVKLVNLVLIQAIKDNTSDIHFEPFEDQCKIRYRVDGMLYEMIPLPNILPYPLPQELR